MKTYIKVLFVAIFCMSGITYAQYFVNAGADVTINSGSSLYIDGDFRNESDGSMNNSGDLFLTGNWTNNQTSGNLLNGTSGKVTFNGTTPQTIDGSHVTYFNDLDLQNDAVLGRETSVASDLILNNTYLALGANNLIMQFGSSISGASGSGYIIAGGNGMLKQNVGSGNKTFPVGTSSSFVPVVLNNSGGTSDYYSVRVFPDVRASGTTGATIPEINDCVDMTWVIQEDVAGGSNLAVTPYWSAGLEGINFDRTHAGVGHYSGGWDPAPEGVASGANPYYITRTGISSLSAFAVGDLESPMAIPIDIRLDVEAFLEGPFNGVDMNDDLKNAGVIPLSQPYNTPPWNYGGSESVLSIPPNVVDWALMEVRDAPNAASATPATIVARKAVFVLNDGTLVNIDGSTMPSFSFTLTNQMFVVIWHRNHLGMMSANPLVDGGGGIYNYDFTGAAGQAYLNGQKNLGGGDYGMYGGNGNKDGVVNGSDYTIWQNIAGENGYLYGDYNMDGEGNNQDKNDSWFENTGSSSTVPN